MPTLRVSAPRVHCGRLKTQGTVAAFEQKLIKEHVDDPSAAKLYLFTVPASSSADGTTKSEVVSSSSSSSSADTTTVVRMESSVLVDRIRTGGNDPSTADETNRAIVVLCTGHGSMSMLGAKHSLAAHIGAAELARLASHSLLGDLQITPHFATEEKTMVLDDAFKHCRERLNRAIFDGASRNSSMNASLLDGAYFSALLSMRPLQPSTVVGKAVDIVDGSPAVKYVCHSGQKITLPALRVSAIVLDCDAKQVWCATSGIGVAAALFKPVRQNPGEPVVGKGFTCEWLSDAQQQQQAENNASDVLNEPNVLRQTLEVGQWLIVGNSGFWQSNRATQREEALVNKIALYLADAKHEHSNDPNRVADALLEMSMKTETDNIVVVVATVNKT